MTYTYDAGNRRTQIADSVGGTITRAFDNFDRLTGETTAAGTASYTYDTLDRRATMTIPGQAQVTYAYDAANRLTSLTQSGNTVQFAYDTASRRTTLTLPNAIATEYGYDANSQLTGLTYKVNGTPIGDLQYGYDPAGQRMLVGGSWGRTGLPATLANASYNANNQQTAFGGQTLTYDYNGNLTSDGTNTYSWDARNRMTAQAGAAAFAYDAVGRRASRTVNGTTTAYVYAGVNLAKEVTASGTTHLLGSLGVDEYVLRTDGSGMLSLLADVLSSTVALVDSAGSVQANYTYEPFGATSVTGAATNKVTFTGREDDSTGLMYYRARYYHPLLQRFISEDPIGFAGGDVNVQAYVANAPTNATDPSGMFLSSSALPADCQPKNKSGSPEPSGFMARAQAMLQSLTRAIACDPTLQLFPPGIVSGGGRAIAARAVDGKFTEEAQIVIQWAKEAVERGGLSEGDAMALWQLAQRAGLSGHGPMTHGARALGPHINIGPIRHIPLK